MYKNWKKIVLAMLIFSLLIPQMAVPVTAGQGISINEIAEQPPEEAGSGEIEAIETEAGEVGAGEIEAGEVGAGEIEAAETEAIETETGEIGAAETEAIETETGEIGAREIEAAVTEAGEIEAAETESGEIEAEIPQESDYAGVYAKDYAGDYAKDYARFGHYYDALTDIDVPSLPQGEAAESDEEIVGASIPASFRTQRLTPVRDQGTSNLCWVFSATALLETSLLARYPGENAASLDLSEEQLAYFYFNRQNDPLGNTGDMKMVYNTSLGKTAYRYASGSPIYLLQELSTGQGVATEAEVPFHLTRLVKSDGTVIYQESNTLPAARLAYISYANISSYELFDYDIDKVKREIMENGAVSVAIYYENHHRNLAANAYYSPANMRSNHVVTLVGWNDAYPRTKFNSDERPLQGGAWIVKNSWGDDWGDGGYFYLSYENATMLGCVSAKAVLTGKKAYRNLYFYDGLSMVGNSCCISPLSAGTGNDIIAGANVFEVKAGKGRGEAIGEVVLCTWTRDAKYRVSIYTDLADTDNPMSGRRALVQTVEMEGAGLNTFTLPAEVKVSAGSWYSVVVENVGQKVESYSAQRNQRINEVSFITDNLFCRSLTRNAKGKWTDMAEDGGGEVLRIRAATRTLGSAVKPKKVFTDVLDPNHAYYSAIYWAADTGIAGGYSDGTFGINKSCTRGEAIMFLWRYAGKPEPAKSSAMTFSDVPSSDSFYKAILWAYQRGITNGYSDGTFGKNRVCTRGHIMMFLWKYLGKPAPKSAAKPPFSDVPKSHPYYKAVLYGSQNGITRGFSDGTFGVDTRCTRGQIVKFLHNMRGRS